MIDVRDLVKEVVAYRAEAIVVPGRAAQHWQEVSAQPYLDVPLGDPAMGGHACFAFGLALALPHTRVILFDSEGDLLMNLGILATIAEKRPRNFYHFLMDNECYATTGGQPVPNAKEIRYDVIAQGAGYKSTYSFENISSLTRKLPGILESPGPVFATLKVIPEIQNLPIDQRGGWESRSVEQVLKELQGWLNLSQRAPHGRNLRIVK